MSLPEKDMYGHKIIPIDDHWGVSVTYYVRGGDGKGNRGEAAFPDFTFFHDSSGAQAVFGVYVQDEPEKEWGREFYSPRLINVFYDRVKEVVEHINRTKENGG